MPKTSPNKKTVEAYMAAFRKSDKPAVLACLTDDVEWIMPGHARLNGKARFEREIVNPDFEPEPDIAVHRLVEEGDVVVAEGSVRTVKKTGEVVRLVFCDVFELRGGKIARLISYLAPA